MYDETITIVRISEGIINDFPLTIGLHQGSILSPYLFCVGMDELTRSVQDEIPWCTLFADDIILWMKLDVGLMASQKFGEI